MWASAAAMLSVTERLRYACGVYVLPLRHSVEVAKQAATLSTLSRGRFTLGVGTGWMREEFDLVRRPEAVGMTSGIHPPFRFAFDGPSTLDQKKARMERFAEDILRQF